MCRVLGVSRQGYYQWKTRGPSAHAVRDAQLASEILRVWEQSRRIYGAPKVFMHLSREGVSTSRKRVARIMRERGWIGVTRRCAKRPDGQEKRVRRADGAPDLVKRHFDADGPNQAWFADITYVRTYRGWLYLAVVMDIWSRRIVGWSMGDRIDARLADDALRMAIARRRPAEGCLHHSDHGSVYGSLVVGKTMRDNGIRPSMGSVDSPWDNAPTESLMGIIKAECVHAKTYDDRDQAALEIFEYMECFYNRYRVHSALGYMSPCEFEEAYASQPLAA
jgi:transposase InsO family protein